MYIIFLNFRDSKSVLFSLALVVIKLLAIFQFLLIKSYKTNLGTHAATWQQKLAADLS